MSILSIAEAERIAGKRLDRRRKYHLWDGEVCFTAKCTVSCTGCFEAGEYGGLAHHYPLDKKLGIRIGSGCPECGYTGKRVDYFPVPHHVADCDDD